MHGLLAYLAPLALIVSPAIEAGIEDTPASHAPTETGVSLPLNTQQSDVMLPFTESFRPQNGAQVRIERRVTIRISPQTPVRNSLVSEAPMSVPQRRVVERKIDDCVPLAGIAGVQSQDDRLLLYMRNRQLVSARLEKKCSARDFYAGFLVEKSKDGRLCVKRDQLQSRTGSKCKLRSFHRLVEERD